ncbi:MAG TPA: cytochrome c [Acetobacteraceae bacterium]|jgi:mono/diheme cytochrome c family protein|nr:cytochrome c [Acetobacteraceae bacterium]
MSPAKLFASLFAGVSVIAAASANAADPRIERGRYLVEIAGCGDCHTAGSLLGHPDQAHPLSGSDVGFATPDGTFFGSNLTPDKATGLGAWSTEEVVTAITTGKRPDGRLLAPVMPYAGLSHLTGRDATAIAFYLKSLSPFANKVAGPFGPGEAPSGLVMTIIPGSVYAGLPKPPAH